MAKIHRGGSPADGGNARGQYRGAPPAGASSQPRKISTAGVKKQRRRRRSSRWAAVILLAAAAFFVVQVYRTMMIPEWMLAALGAGLALVWILIVRAQKYRVRGAIGRFLAWCLSACLLVGCVFTQQGIAALEKITAERGGTVIGVYVLSADAAKSLADTQDYTFGCLNQQVLANTDSAITQIAATSETANSAVGYDSVFSLTDALYDGDVQAIILNRSFVDVIEEEDGGHATFAKDTRCIFTCRIASGSTTGGVTGAAAQKITQEPFVMYLSGVDTRGDLSDTCRSDVNILAAVNPQTRQVLLINTPRDYYVELAGADGAMDKLTHAGLYGVDCSMQTLSTLYGVQVQYYLKVNFAGFVEIIDALGGIDVQVDKGFTTVGSPDYYDPVTFTAGENHLTGAQALAFARERHAFSDGDIQRGENQMQVIRAVLLKAQSPEVLKHYSRLMSSVSDSFVTSLSQDQIGALVKMQLREGGDWDVQSIGVTGTSGKSTKCYSAKGSNLYIMKQDPDQIAAAKAALQAVLSGTPVDSAAGSAAGASGSASAA
jgi:LCP family protein required for cell wall assembly